VAHWTKSDAGVVINPMVTGSGIDGIIVALALSDCLPVVVYWIKLTITFLPERFIVYDYELH